ncbi:MAG TPA: glycosyltransferase [Mycobacteriales bacterium]|nr:glycosyltransferase [Mycobacteriales bacterium]
MRVVVEGLPITGDSLAIVVDGLLHGWQSLGVDDLHLVTSRRAQLDIPDGVTVHWVDLSRQFTARRLLAQNVVVPKICRQLKPDALVGVLPTTTIAPLPCPRAVILYDLRHEILPQQFSPRALRLRTWSYNIGFRQADAIVAISERSRNDLLRSRPWLDPRRVGVGYLAADHTDSWPKSVVPEDERYAVAFGHYANKNVPTLLEAWALLRDEGRAPLRLQLFGVPSDYRAVVVAKIAELDLGDLVTPLPWLDAADMHARFASSSLVVFPSEFEGFGMPAAEAMRLRIPLVISPDPALVEVAGGHAAVMAGWSSRDLAEAIGQAMQSTEAELASAAEFAQRYTWANMARSLHDMLEYAVANPK